MLSAGEQDSYIYFFLVSWSLYFIYTFTLPLDCLHIVEMHFLENLAIDKSKFTFNFGINFP